jgi:homoserine dehydrogenase
MVREVSVAILGVGGVGGALLRQILENREWHRDQFDLFIRIIGICDSKGMVGLSGSPEEDQLLRQVLICKENGGSLTDVFGSLSKPDFSEMVLPPTGGPTIVVDCTAEDSAASALLACLEHGCKLVMANKKPMTSDQDQFDRFHHAGLRAASRKAGVSANWWVKQRRLDTQSPIPGMIWVEWTWPGRP